MEAFRLARKELDGMIASMGAKYPLGIISPVVTYLLVRLFVGREL
jgi:hypothetical protein